MPFAPRIFSAIHAVQRIGLVGGSGKVMIFEVFE
jgi:hypothetical protein